MIAFLEITPLILILIIMISFIILYSLYVIKSLLHRTIILLLGVSSVIFCVVLIANVLGFPRSLGWMQYYDKTYQLISHMGIENEGIYLWLLDSELNKPIYYFTEWDANLDTKIRNKIRKEKIEGGRIEFHISEGIPGGGDSPAAGGNIIINHIPPVVIPKE